MEAKRHPSKHNNLPYLLTGGDPAGISAEICIDTIEYFVKNASDCDCLIYFHTSNKSDLKILIDKIRFLNSQAIVYDSFEKLKEWFIEYSKESSKNQNAIIIFDVSECYKNDYQKQMLKKGKPNELSGFLSWKALDLACFWIESFGTLGLLTAPLSKKWVDQAIKKNNTKSTALKTFSGHTNYLADRFESNVLMLMHGKKFSVVPLTTHISISEVPKQLKSIFTSDDFKKNLLLLSKMNIFKNTKWAMCALNPHAGEGGLMGNEEIDFIKSWCQSNHSKQIDIDGPLPSDALFTQKIRKKYRLIFSCYHDQGLIPFKAIEAEDGINFTIGLPFSRCSPDHGTAYDIAGKNKASSRSMMRAMQILLNQELNLE